MINVTRLDEAAAVNETLARSPHSLRASSETLRQRQKSSSVWEALRYCETPVIETFRRCTAAWLSDNRAVGEEGSTAMCALKILQKRKKRAKLSGQIWRKRLCVPISPLPVFLSNSVFALLTSRHSRLAPPTPNFMSTLVPPPKRSHSYELCDSHIWQGIFFFPVECHLSIQSSSSSTHPFPIVDWSKGLKWPLVLVGACWVLTYVNTAHPPMYHLILECRIPWPIEGKDLNGHENQFYGAVTLS